MILWRMVKTNMEDEEKQKKHEEEQKRYLGKHKRKLYDNLSRDNKEKIKELSASEVLDFINIKIIALIVNLALWACLIACFVFVKIEPAWIEIVMAVLLIAVNCNMFAIVKFFKDVNKK